MLYVWTEGEFMKAQKSNLAKKSVSKVIPSNLKPKILVRVEKPKENDKVYSVECGRCPPGMM